jgi:hypothetical protein
MLLCNPLSIIELALGLVLRPLDEEVDRLVLDDEDRVVPGHGIPGTGTQTGPDAAGAPAIEFDGKNWIPKKVAATTTE